MRHVDEGTIHAWLDHQISDPMEAARVEEHIRACSACAARLAEERTTFDQAQSLLAVVEPARTRPSFEELAARAGGATERPGARAVRTPGRRWLFPLTQAAVIVLAVGLGWMARGLTEPEAPEPPSPAASSAIQPLPGSSGGPVASAQHAAPPVAGDSAAAPVQQGAERRAVPRGEATAARQRSGTGADSSVTGSAANAAVPSRDVARADGVAPSIAATARRETLELSRATPPEATLTTLTGTAPTVSSPQPVAAPPPAARPVLGGIAGQGFAQPAPAIPLQVAEWRSLPRTEAAARTGMALYGIEGMEPALTALSADGARVRTTYQLPSGESVELVQERFTPRLEETAAVQQTTRAGRGGARGGVVGDQVAAAREWSAIRGDVRITLRTTAVTADIDALGTKLRVD